MTFMNSTSNIKQFRLVRFVNENCDDDHLLCRISIVLRRDKIEAPYYMVTKIKISSCIDRPENGLIHAMDMLSHHRRFNLTKDKFNQIKTLALDESSKSDLVKISEKDGQVNISMLSRNDEELEGLFEAYAKLFDLIDDLVD